jgi:hypothetical protein
VAPVRRAWAHADGARSYYIKNIGPVDPLPQAPDSPGANTTAAAAAATLAARWLLA